MATTNKIKIRLQGHEKFPLREGWINKALVEVPKDAGVFLNKDATDTFGIGSNMVKSLRYWMKAFGLMEEAPGAGASLSDVGKIIAQYDPYLEKSFTLWIMHSYIAKNREEATTWYMYFNHCDAEDLEKTEIESILLRELKKYVGGQSFSEKSLSNDIDVLLNMYSKSKEQSDPEDKNVSPFAQLALVKCVEGRYIKCHPSKKTFSDMIVLYEIMQLLNGKESISIEEAVLGENGLSNIYNLTSVMANDYFDRLDASGYIRVNRTAGLDVIYPVKRMELVEILEEYYKNC